MRAADRKKLVDAGFDLIRTDDSNTKPTIKYLTKRGSWKTYGTFETQNERNDYFNSLLQSEKIIEG